MYHKIITINPKTIKPYIQIYSKLKYQQTNQQPHNDNNPNSILLKYTNHKYHKYIQLGRYDKPIGSVLVLIPFALSSLLHFNHIDQFPTIIHNIGLFTISAFTLRAGGCIVNDFWDTNFDKQVERTRNRPFASKKVSYSAGFLFLIANFLSGMGAIYMLGHNALYSSLLAIPLTIIYPLMKRFTHYPQYFLGISINYGLWIANYSISNDINLTTNLPLYLGLLCWTVIYDTIYAHQDKHFDQKLDLGSTALKWKHQTIPKLIQHNAFMYLGFITTGIISGVHLPIFLTSSFLLFLKQTYLIKKIDINNKYQSFGLHMVLLLAISKYMIL